MTKTYHVNTRVRIVNRIMGLMIRWGIAPPHSHLLTVRGHKSGKFYTNPVTLVEEDGGRWLIAPYGEVSWVKNVRVASEVMLRRGRDVETVTPHEIPLDERAPILKNYLAIETITQPYFDAGPDSPLEAFAAEAERHPVFLLESK